MQIPYQSLSSDTLRNLVEEYVTREGTDYGDYNLSLDDKVSAVIAKLHSGEVVILYIECNETVNIVEKALLNSQ